MSEAKQYGIMEVDLMLQRFKIASHGTPCDFFEWIGLHQTHRALPLGLVLADPTRIAKVDACLSPHWFALIRASLAREDK